jgi:hypothetical protein
MVTAATRTIFPSPAPKMERAVVGAQLAGYL